MVYSQNFTVKNNVGSEVQFQLSCDNKIVNLKISPNEVIKLPSCKNKGKISFTVQNVSTSTKIFSCIPPTMNDLKNTRTINYKVVKDNDKLTCLLR